jgi:transposase
MFPFLVKLFADAGYQGPKFRNAAKEIMPQLTVEIVKRSDQVKGFKFVPKRWVVEQTIARLGRCRRLAKDFETQTCNALAFLRLASIRLPDRCPKAKTCVSVGTSGIASAARLKAIMQNQLHDKLWESPNTCPKNVKSGDRAAAMPQLGPLLWGILVCRINDPTRWGDY